MSTATPRLDLADNRHHSVLWALLLWSLVTGVMGSPTAGAHASLDRAEPPVDGLVVASPAQLRLYFTEEVAAANPAPSIKLLDEEGEPQDVQVRQVAPGGDSRTVIADVEPLERGTYTVAWSVRSATDGHQLSGTYAFRVGGGIPPGLATTEGETPAPWAVATRWLTFLGVSAAAAGFLFPIFVLRRAESATSESRRHRIILAGSTIALLASLAEPILQSLFPPEQLVLDVPSALRALPSAWWYRPIGLAIALLLAMAMLSPYRDRLSVGHRAIAWVGAVAALSALLGLSLTSHAAGQDTWRSAALASNFLHQVVVALWIGGLLHLALWWPTRAATSEDDTITTPVRRFSLLALPMVVLALLTGLVNTGFAFPLQEGLEEFGFAPNAFATLWTSDYGYVLIAKVLILIIPLALAAYHRRAVARAARTLGETTQRMGAGLRKTLRLEVLTVLAVILGGSTLALSAPPTVQTAPLDRLVLTAPAHAADGTTTDIVHLEADPAAPGDNVLTLRVTDPEGTPIPASPAPRITLDFLSLDHGTSDQGRQLQPVAGEPATFTSEGLELSLEGWWSVTVTIRRQGQDDTQARIYLLLPDPNTNGFDAPPEPSTSAEAQAVFERGLATMLSWSSVRVTERVASGSDALVVVERAVTTATNNQPLSNSFAVQYSGSFAPTATGDPPSPPLFDPAHDVTIGDQGWRRLADGTWEESRPRPAEPPSEWGNTYDGAEQIRLGTTEEINGELAQVVTFHTPDQERQSEAWFVWWVGTETGHVYRAAMIARQHYMVWEYSSINEPFVITRPDE